MQINSHNSLKREIIVLIAVVVSLLLRKLLYELGVDPKDAQNRLRHKNIKTTMDIYTHLSEKQKQTPISKLEHFSSKGTILGTTEQNNEKIK